MVANDNTTLDQLGNYTKVRGADFPALDHPHLRDRAKSSSSSTGRSPDDVLNTVRQKQAVSEVAPHSLGDSGLGSPASFRAFTADLTRLNLPTALPDVALTYRTNEWASTSALQRPLTQKCFNFLSLSRTL